MTAHAPQRRRCRLRLWLLARSGLRFALCFIGTTPCQARPQQEDVQAWPTVTLTTSAKHWDFRGDAILGLTDDASHAGQLLLRGILSYRITDKLSVGGGYTHYLDDDADAFGKKNSVPYRVLGGLRGLVTPKVTANFSAGFELLLNATSMFNHSNAAMPGWLVPALVYIAFLAVPFTWWVLFRTRFGLRLRAVGEKLRAEMMKVQTPSAEQTGVRAFFVMPRSTFVTSGGVYPRLIEGRFVHDQAVHDTVERAPAGHH